MLIDTHCHLTYDELAPQIDDVLRRAAEAGVARCITIATSPADAQRALRLAEPRPQVFISAGIHPHEAAKIGSAELADLTALHRGEGISAALAARVVAVGETGLDFHYDFAPPARQEEVFRYQLALACDVGRPVVIHARKAEERVCDILCEYPPLRDRVVFHCYSADEQIARRILDCGFWLSFTGVVTFKNSDAIRAAARVCPADRIMVETDSPFLSPEPMRKIRPCEPALVVHTARFLADLRQEPFERFAEQTTANAVRFFGLPI